MTAHGKFEELVYVYSIGALDGEDLEEFEKHLNAGCQICAKILKDSSEVISVIPYSTEPVAPPQHLEKRIMNSIASSGVTSGRIYKPSFWHRISPAWYSLATALACFIIFISIAGFFQLKQEISDKESQISRLTTQLDTQNSQIEELQTKLQNSSVELASMRGPYDKFSEVADYLQNPDVVIINLVSLLPELKAVGRILWNTSDNKVVFVSSNLPEAPAGKIYQMWLIAGGTPISVGIFNVGARSENIVDLGKLSEVKDIKTFAVTLEPEGGVPSPTGKMYLAGDV